MTTSSGRMPAASRASREGHAYSPQPKKTMRKVGRLTHERDYPAAISNSTADAGMGRLAAITRCRKPRARQRRQRPPRRPLRTASARRLRGGGAPERCRSSAPRSKCLAARAPTSPWPPDRDAARLRTRLRGAHRRGGGALGQGAGVALTPTPPLRSAATGRVARHAFVREADGHPRRRRHGAAERAGATLANSIGAAAPSSGRMRTCSGTFPFLDGLALEPIASQAIEPPPDVARARGRALPELVAIHGPRAARVETHSG